MNLYDVLKKIEINYEEVEHEAVYTIEQAKLIENRLDGVGCKNLFLTNRKGKYLLVILEENKKANIKEIEKIASISHLSFASEEDLENILNLKRGSVTPFGIINDSQNKVLLVIDKDLKDNLLLFHPNVNTKTMSVTYDDLIKFIEYEKHEYISF